MTIFVFGKLILVNIGGIMKKQKKLKLKIGQEGHLSDLRRGQKAIVLNFHNDNKALRRRLLDMGITRGVLIEVKKIAPLGDPVDIALRGYELCIRKADMQSIDVKVVE